MAPTAHSLTHTTTTKKPAQLGINRDGQTRGGHRLCAAAVFHGFCCRLQCARRSKRHYINSPDVRSFVYARTLQRRLRTLTTATLHYECTIATGALDDGLSHERGPSNTVGRLGVTASAAGKHRRGP